MSCGWGVGFGVGVGFGFEIVILVPRFCYVVIIRIAWTNEESNSVSRDVRMRKHVAGCSSCGLVLERFLFSTTPRETTAESPSTLTTGNVLARSRIAQLHLLFHIHWILKSTDLKTLND